MNKTTMKTKKRTKKQNLKASSTEKIVIIFASALLVLIFLLAKLGSGVGVEEDNGSDSFLIPIWIGIFIPIMVGASCEKKNTFTRNEKIMIYGFLPLLVVSGIIFLFLLF